MEMVRTCRASVLGTCVDAGGAHAGIHVRLREVEREHAAVQAIAIALRERTVTGRARRKERAMEERD